jgi:cyclic-di-GMP-binding protein
MPSFDVVSELDGHEVANAVDQANREVNTRFDFKGTGASFELNEFVVSLEAQAEFQLKQMLEILTQKLARRGVDVACMKPEDPEIALNKARQKVALRHGIDSDNARKIVKLVKDSKLKVQSQVQGEQVRITGKKRDDLQEAIALLRKAELELPLQYTNFRD